MDYEQKYKEALEKAKEYYTLCEKCGAKDTVDFLEDSFPELKESEDEKVRKEILEVAKTVVLRDGTLYGKKYNCREWIAWLEKQGQKSAWSKKDEEIVTGIIKDIQERLEDYPTEQLADIYFEEIKWLKSVKERMGGTVFNG